MGRALLFIVMAAALGGSLLIHQTHSTSLRTDGELSEHGAQILAREAAKSGLGVALSDVHLAFGAHPARRDLVSLNDPRATYDVEIDETDQATVRIVATGRFDGDGGTGEQRERWRKAHQIRAELVRLNTGTGAGLYISTPRLTPRLNGVAFEISGEDVRPGDLGDRMPGAGQGGSAITVSSEDLLLGLRPTNPNLRRLIHGVGGEADIQIGALPVWLDRLIETARANPDVVYEGDVDQNDAIAVGTAADPRIVVVRGDVRLNHAGQGNPVGHGILFVEGDLQLGGSFQWNGIIVARKVGAMDVTFHGRATVYGTVVIDNPASGAEEDDPSGGGRGNGRGSGGGAGEASSLDLTLQGNIGIFYSREAIGRLADLAPALAATTEIRVLDQRSGDPTMPAEGLAGR